MCEPLTLFGPPDPPPPPAVAEPDDQMWYVGLDGVTRQVSAGRRRTLRQRAAVAAGVHPLALLFPGIRVNSDPARRCGNCVHRQRFRHRNRAYPKCTVGGITDGPGGRMSHGSATDVRAWWPGCEQHEPEAAS
jgi:hypothetical protein